MAIGHTNEMELRAQIEQDYLTCQICQGPFKRPKALNCLHSFCACCLDEYLTTKKVAAGGRFECPVCRKAVELPVNGMDGFPDNHLIVSLADTINNVNRRPSPLQQRIDDILYPNQGNLPLQFQKSVASNAGMWLNYPNLACVKSLRTSVDISMQQNCLLIEIFRGLNQFLICQYFR